MREVPVPQFLKETVEVVKIIPQERIAERTSEHVADVPVPQFLKETVEVVKIIHQERFAERTSARASCQWLSCEQTCLEPKRTCARVRVRVRVTERE